MEKMTNFFLKRSSENAGVSMSEAQRKKILAAGRQRVNKMSDLKDAELDVTKDLQLEIITQEESSSKPATAKINKREV